MIDAVINVLLALAVCFGVFFFNINRTAAREETAFCFNPIALNQ